MVLLSLLLEHCFHEGDWLLLLPKCCWGGKHADPCCCRVQPLLL
jgi:hypothetical protein